MICLLDDVQVGLVFNNWSCVVVFFAAAVPQLFIQMGDVSFCLKVASAHLLLDNANQYMYLDTSYVWSFFPPPY